MRGKGVQMVSIEYGVRHGLAYFLCWLAKNIISIPAYQQALAPKHSLFQRKMLLQVCSGNALKKERQPLRKWRQACQKDKIAMIYCIEPLLVKSRLAYLPLACEEGLV